MLIFIETVIVILVVSTSTAYASTPEGWLTVENVFNSLFALVVTVITVLGKILMSQFRALKEQVNNMGVTTASNEARLNVTEHSIEKLLDIMQQQQREYIRRDEVDRRFNELQEHFVRSINRIETAISNIDKKFDGKIDSLKN